MNRANAFRYFLLLLAVLLAEQTPSAHAAYDYRGERGYAKVSLGRGAELEQQTSALEFSAANAADALAAPVIRVWYGTTQSFGLLGKPQRQINILGNVQGATSLAYSLNGGPYRSLAIGGVDAVVAAVSDDKYAGGGGGMDEALHRGPLGNPEPITVTAPSRLPPPWTAPVPLSADVATDVATLAVVPSSRLVSPGDFNVEINTADLRAGENEVVIRANNGAATEAVTVNYMSGQVWEQPYIVDWSDVADISDVAQIVDGQWEIDNGYLRTQVTGYDRLVAIGDVGWDDFQVTVPIMVNSWPHENDGGVGVLARWQGHFAVGNEQPAQGWWQMGAYGYYRHADDAHGGSQLAMYTGHYDIFRDNSGFTLSTRRPYYFKMRVQTKEQGLSGFYSFKVWREDRPEPSSWTFEVQDEPPEELFNGSLLLVAHEVDASFGTVEILPVLDVTVSKQGSGAVELVPQLSGQSDAYIYGDVVTVTATPDPGWSFVGWSGDLSAMESPLAVALTDDLEITANFAQGYGLEIGVVGQGDVLRDPEGPRYPPGTLVTLAPTQPAGWSFEDWDGLHAGELVNNNDSTWTLEMNGEKELTAVFAQDQYTVTTVAQPQGSGTVSLAPDNPYTYGEWARLRAIPELGWSFGAWEGPDTAGMVDNEDGTWSLQVDGHKVITATFVQNEYEIAVMVEPDDRGSVLVEPDYPVYRYGQLLTLTPLSHPGWRFDGWSGADAVALVDAGDGGWLLLVDGDKEVTAVFITFGVYLPLVSRGAP